MSVGADLRKFRERRGMSLLQLSLLTGLSEGYLSKLETGRRQPSWSTLCRIAEAWDLEPIVHFATRVDREEAEAFRAASPGDRLRRTSYDAYEALRRMLAVEEFAVTGAVAGVLHGLPMRIEELQLLVVDDDEVVERMLLCLRRALAFYTDISVEDYRDMRRTQWVVDRIDADIRLVDALPPTATFDLEEFSVRALALADLVAADPVAAAAFAAST